MEAAAGRRRLRTELREREGVKPLELYFDLVFVLAFTQCTALMVAHPTWEALAQGVLVLGVLWWAWEGYAWLTSYVEPEEGLVRFAVFAAMAALLVVALSVPEAFGDRALAFAAAYAVVRLMHSALFEIASRDEPELRRAVNWHAGTSVVVVALLFAGAAADGLLQGTLWALAIAADVFAPARFGMGAWRLSPAHFAERHNLIIILALGESVVVLGVAATVGLSAGVIAAAALGIGLTSALWWIYFDIVSLVTERRLSEAQDSLARNILARDSYAYLHFPMVAGIVLAALGLEQTLAHVDEHLHTVPAFALLGGIALYLLAHVAMRYRNARTVSVRRLATAGLLLALWPLALEISALAILAIVNGVLWILIASETRMYGDSRYRFRHGLEVELPEQQREAG